MRDFQPKMPSDKFVIQGPEYLQPVPDESVGEKLYQSLLSHKKVEPALINGHTGKSISYPELLKATCSLAEALRNAGYGTNTIISISSRNNLKFFIPVISALYVGASVAPINHCYTLTELNHILNMIKPKVIFCSEDQLQKYSEMRKKMKFIEEIIVIDSEKNTPQAYCLEDFIRKHKGSSVSRFSTTPVDSKDQVALVMCSSGTTGLPKGVMLTHWNMNAMYNHFLDHRFHISRNPTTLCLLPFFHAYGFYTCIAGIIMNCTTIYLDEFQPQIYLKSIQDYRVSRLYLAPSLVVFLAKSPLVLKYDLSSVNEAYCGAAPLKKSTQEEFLRRFNLKTIQQGYGLTEATLGIMTCEANMPESITGSSGRIFPGVKVGVRDLETGEFLGPNKQGEICIKGDLVMKGYLGNPGATKNTFTEDGWLLTGDAGYYDEDEYFYITDRIKELIKYKGFQVAPAEIEAILLTHEEIIDSGVVGLPDERFGELPSAFVVKTKDSKLTEQDVQDFVQSKLSQQKWLRGGVIFVEAIPKSPTGKILRKDLCLMLKKHKSKL